MVQHHGSSKQDCNWIGQTFASNVRCGAMYRFKNRCVFANIGAWCHPQTANQTQFKESTSSLLKAWFSN